MKSLLIVLACLLGLPSALSADEPTAEDMNIVSIKIRARHGLKAQKLDKALCKIADRWAERIAKTGKLVHGGGEQIIAMGYKTTDAVFKAWMKSKGHRAWILSKTTRCGWSCKTGRNGKRFWVGVFRK